MILKLLQVLHDSYKTKLKMLIICYNYSIKEPPLYATVQKENRGKIVETKTDDSPPYNFRQAVTGQWCLF